MKKSLFNIVLCSLVLAVTATSCKHITRTADTFDALLAHIDTTAKAGNDFFQYANGRWFKQNPIPASEQSNGIFQLIQDTIIAQVRKICESSAAIPNQEKGSNKQKIGRSEERRVGKECRS